MTICLIIKQCGSLTKTGDFRPIGWFRLIGWQNLRLNGWSSPEAVIRKLWIKVALASQELLFKNTPRRRRHVFFQSLPSKLKILPTDFYHNPVFSYFYQLITLSGDKKISDKPKAKQTESSEVKHGGECMFIFFYYNKMQLQKKKKKEKK